MELLLPVEAFKEVYNYFKNHEVPTNMVGHSLEPYSPFLSTLSDTNNDKLPQLDSNELSSIRRIRSCKNLPPNSKVSSVHKLSNQSN